MPTLRNGDSFPFLTFQTIGYGTMSLPSDLAGSYGVMLLYRGAWCPFCKTQLAGFSHAASKFAQLRVKVVALSVDDEAATVALVEELHLGYPVGYGADADKVAAATGAYVNDSPRYLQSTGFVLDPNGKVITAVYSSGAIGRLVADDVAGFVGYVQSHRQV